jgi:hypothetical protein
LAAQAAPAPSQDGLPTVGDTVASSQWEVTLIAYGPFVSEPGLSQGSGQRRVVVEFAAKNLQRWTGTITTSSLVIGDGKGRTFRPAGQTASIEKGFWLTWVQSEQRVEQRALFELPADATGLTLTVLDLRFRLPD